MMKRIEGTRWLITTTVVLTACIITAGGFAQELPTVQQVSFKKDTFNIENYGAVADAVTLNTKAISGAIEACHQSGGGTVLIPKGFWLTGPVTLKSNVNLHVAAGAVLQFSNNTE